MGGNPAGRHQTRIPGTEFGPSRTREIDLQTVKLKKDLSVHSGKRVTCGMKWAPFPIVDVYRLSASWGDKFHMWNGPVSAQRRRAGVR